MQDVLQENKELVSPVPVSLSQSVSLALPPPLLKPPLTLPPTLCPPPSLSLPSVPPSLSLRMMSLLNRCYGFGSFISLKLKLHLL